MRFLLNVLWIIFGGGFLTALEYLLAGVVLSLTVVGLPFGMQSFKLAGLAFMPFGKDIEEVPRSAPGAVVGTFANVLWFVLAGIWIFLTHLGLAVGLAVTIIGIPFALQHLKLAVLALWPFGRKAR
ncbi:MAG: YccF domain-containing protein [Deltaproteobacteria bacterium]